MLTETGIVKDDEVIVYSSGGVRAGFVVTAMRIAGCGNVRSHDDSMRNRAADSSLELAPD